MIFPVLSLIPREYLAKQEFQVHALCHCLLCLFSTKILITWAKQHNMFFLAIKFYLQGRHANKGRNNAKDVQKMWHGPLSFCPSVSRPVEKTLCAGPAPLPSQLCNNPCSTDCIVSSWSAWGLCIHENCHDPQGKKGESLVYMRFIYCQCTNIYSGS